MKLNLSFYILSVFLIASCTKEVLVPIESMKYQDMLGDWNILETTTVVIDGQGTNSERNLSIEFREPNAGFLGTSEIIWSIQCNPDAFLISTKLNSSGGGNLTLFTTRRFVIGDFSSSAIQMITDEVVVIDGQNRQVKTVWTLSR